MRDKHPSGRPIRGERIVAKTVWRIPDKGPVTPRLQEEKAAVSAIGFTAHIVSNDDGA